MARLGSHRLWHGAAVAAVAVSADGKVIASAASRGAARDRTWIGLWESANGKKLHTVTVTSGAIHGLSFSPDGRTLAAGCGELVCLWDAATGKRKDYPGIHVKEVSFVHFSADGKTMLSGDESGTVCQWDRATARRLHQWQPWKDKQPRLSNGMTAEDCGAFAVSADGKILVWQIRSYKAVGNAAVAVGERCLLRFRDLGSDAVREIKVPPAALGSIAVAPDGRVLATGFGGVWLWDAATGRQLRRMGNELANVTGLAFSPDGQTLVSRHADNTLRLWDVKTGRALSSVPSPKADEVHARARPFAFSRDGATLVLGQPGGLLLWDVKTGREIRLGAGHREPIRQVAFAADGRTLTTAGRRSRCRWDTTSWKEIDAANDRTPSAGRVGSPDGSLSAWVGEDHTVHVVNAVSGAEIRQLKAVGMSAAPPIFSPRGDYLAVRLAEPAHAVRIWRMPSGENIGCVRLAVQQEGTGTIAGLALSPDGRILATGQHGENAIRLWETASGQQWRRLDGHGGAVLALAFSSDGATLVSGSEDWTALVWDLRTPKRPRKTRLTAAELASLWVQLRGDAGRAIEAIGTLGDAPKQSVPFLKERLKPVEVLTEQQIQRLIANLDSDEFPIREKASRRLAQLAERVEPSLRKTLTEKPTLEMRRRIDFILADLPAKAADRASEELRTIRAVVCLERAATPEARDALRLLSRGDPKARLTREAKIALQRLEKR
jgi:WD40 repeat protein